MGLESKAKGLRKGFKKNALKAGRINHQATPHGHDQAPTPTATKINPLTGRKYWCLEDDYLDKKIAPPTKIKSKRMTQC